MTKETLEEQAIKVFADYFETSISEAKDCNHMTIECMVMFALSDTVADYHKAEYIVSLLDEVKEGINREVAIVAAGLRQVHQILERGNAGRH